MKEQEFISKWLGAPWVDRGLSVEGVDCWGLIVAYFDEVKGIDLKKPYDYENIETGFDGEIDSNKWKEVERPCADLVFMSFVGSVPSHVGLCISKSHVLHCPGTPENPGSVSVHSIRALKKVNGGKMKFYKYLG